MRRVLLKDVAILYWHLPQNNDPTSVLHSSLNPDIPAEDIYESDLHPARARWGRYENGPSIFFSYPTKDGIQPLPGALIRSGWNGDDPGRDESVELFQVVLSQGGRLVDKHTDFNLPDTIPIQFQRVMIHGGWTAPQAFGISGTDNYDEWLFAPDHMRHITVMKADGGSDDLVRVRFWPLFLAHDKWVDSGYSGKYFEMRWKNTPFLHSEVKRFDGDVESYLPCDNSDTCYVIGYRNAQGQKLVFQRDAHRRLTRLTSPNKRWISLSYGNGPAIAEIADSRGRTVHYGYNNLGQLTSVTYPSGETYYYEFDGTQRLLTFSVAPDAKTAPRVMLRNAYDHGRLVKQTLAGGRVYTYSYSSANSGAMHTVRVTTPEGEIYDVDITGWDAAVRESGMGVEP